MTNIEAGNQAMTPKQQTAIEKAHEILQGAKWLREIKPSKDILGRDSITIYFIDKSRRPNYLHSHLAPFRVLLGVPVIWEKVERSKASETYFSDEMIISTDVMYPVD
jgi:hypothetical protein